MKIGLICRGRTRSSAIIRSLAHRYNLENLNESYFTILENVEQIQQLNKKILKNNTSYIEIIKQRIINLTNKNFSNDNFIVKLWPSMLFFPDYNFNLPNNIFFENVKNNVIFNISECWKIKHYDMLFFLDRNLNDSVYSWVWGKHTGQILIYKGEKENNSVITLTENDFNRAKEHILVFCLQQKIKEFLINSNLKVTYLNSNHNLYIDNDVINIKNSNKNYKNLIQNIDELDKLISDWYPICLENTKDWQFY